MPKYFTELCAYNNSKLKIYVFIKFIIPLKVKIFFGEKISLKIVLLELENLKLEMF